jgi:hypothetical protein
VHLRKQEYRAGVICAGEDLHRKLTPRNRTKLEPFSFSFSKPSLFSSHVVDPGVLRHAGERRGGDAHPGAVGAEKEGHRMSPATRKGKWPG